MAKKKEYKMHKEILEQPIVIEKLIRKYLKNKIVVFPEFEKRINVLKKIKRITLLGCGSSYHAAIFGNYFIEDLTGLPCEFEYADEFIKRKAVVEPGTAIVIISQSGQTTDAIKSAEKAKKHKALVIAITNDAKSKLAQISDLVIDTIAGKEQAIAATKTFTAQLTMIILLGLHFSQLNKKAGSKRMKIIAELKLIPSKINKIFQTEKEIKRLAGNYKNAKNFAVLGEKWNYPVALEGALKLMETNSIEVGGFPAGEFKHGPISIVNKNFPLIFIAPKDNTFKNNLSILRTVQKDGADICLITSAGNRAGVKNIIYIPKTIDILYPLLSVLPLQLFSYFLAIAKSINVDKPQHLSKYVK